MPMRSVVHSQSQNNSMHDPRPPCAAEHRQGGTKVESVKIPRYCQHKATGQGVVYIGRREIYLGPYGAPESLKLYSQVIARWQAGGVSAVLGDGGRRRKLPGDLAVVELVSRFIPWARGRYVQSPSELCAFGVATRRLLRLYADTAVRDFGPLALQAVRSAMIADDLCRNVVNAAVHRIRRIWKWAVRNELIDETLWRALCSVPALAAGEESVRESEPVGPARWRQVRAVLRCAPPLVRLMVRLQILTGMRPGELTQMRPEYVDRSGVVWLYRPPKHKTKSKNKPRVISIGPRAQALLGPMLEGRSPGQYVFVPGFSVQAYQRRRTYRGTRPPSHDPDHRLQLQRQRGSEARRDGEHYSVASYRRAIRRACERLYPLPARLARAKGETAAAWRRRLGEEGMAAVAAHRREHLMHPHQLRHSFATRVGNRYGEESAQKLLGHSRLQTTAIYVERDLRAVRPIVQRMG